MGATSQLLRKYRDRRTERFVQGDRVPAFQAIERKARLRIDFLESVESLTAFRMYPGMRLETLRGDRAGQYSIRINDQWRICFEWVNGEAVNIEIVDYHS